MQLYSFRNLSDAIFLVVALTLAVSSFLLIASTLVDHLRNYKYPTLQACCMRILLLAPIYAIASWLMMVFLPVSGYIEVLRDAYEGYALICFWVMLVLWCGGQRRVIEVMAREEKLACYLCPLVQNFGCGLPVFKWWSSSSYFRFLRIGVTQLMVVKPVIAVLCATMATYGTPSHPRIRQLRLLVLVSTSFAMHSIFTVYMATKPYMRGLRASRKFLLIKSVVAIILLQQFAVNAALSMGVIPEGRYGYTAEDRAKRMYCTLTIMEMAVFSLLLSYSFSHTSMVLPESAGGSKTPLKGGGVSASKGASPASAAPPHPQAPQATTTASAFFELVMGDSSATATRKLAASLPHPEAVSLLPVLILWDVLLMGRVEEVSALSGTAGLPVEADDVSLINSSLDLESSPVIVSNLVTIGSVGEYSGGNSTVSERVGSLVGASQRCSLNGATSSVLSVEEGVATRDSQQHAVSTGGIWSVLGLPAASWPRHAARVLNKR